VTERSCRRTIGFTENGMIGSQIIQVGTIQEII
jgi:hypothetical protein